MSRGTVRLETPQYSTTAQKTVRNALRNRKKQTQTNTKEKTDKPTL